MDRTSFDKIKRLLGKYLHQELTPEEQLQLDAWVAESADNRRFFERLSDSGHFEQEFRQFARSREAILSAVYQQIPALNKQPAKLTRLSFRRWWAAAAILLLLAGGTYLWIQPKKNAESEGAMVKTPEIAPGREGAILTLADGTQVVLDSLGNGLVAAVNGAQILLKNGQLAYDVTGEIAGHTTYNTVTTPKGRQFQIILPDGSKVWLNAASSIRYPTVFSGEERKVDVRGEAYFEVKQNPEMPFRVTIYNSAEVVVLGTQFNVDAYEEEQKIKTTLVEGSISVTSAGAKGGEKSLSGGDGLQPSVGIRPVVLKPGQQAQLQKGPGGSTGKEATIENIKVIDHADIEKVLAWKNGLFDFNGLTFEEIMRQLERWYDIDVVYEGNIVPDKRLIGKMTRGVPLNGLLKNLEKLGVRYKLSDRTLTVLP